MSNSYYFSMINLASRLSKKLCDGHVHLFDRTGVLDTMYKGPETLYRVGFINVYLPQVALYTPEVIDSLYSNYIRYNKKDSDILLAGGQTADGLIALYEKYKDDIKGFGELKCYDYYNGQRLTPGYKNTLWLEPICEYIVKNGLHTPIYIHWNLDSKVDELDALLQKYPQVTFLVCHCGMDNIKHDSYKTMTDEDNKQCLTNLIDLMSRHQSLWTDVSWAARDYFIRHPRDLSKLDLDRVVVGSDCSPVGCLLTRDPQSLCDGYYNGVRKLSNRIDNENNIKKLFSL